MILQTGARRLLNNNHSRSGFTLIELSLVALVISIIVAIATPQFRATFETIKFRNTAFNLVKLMNYARDRAIIERKPFRIHFFEDEGSFCLETIPESEKKDGEKLARRSGRRKDEEKFEQVKGSLGQKMQFPQGVTVDIDEPSRAQYITFYPDGQADECVIYIKGNKDVTYTVTTKKMVGLVKLYREKKRL